MTNFKSIKNTDTCSYNDSHGSAIQREEPTGEQEMSIEQKGMLIAAIITQLKFTAKNQKKAFYEGDTFFSLVFKSDSELRLIAKLTGI